MNKAVFLDRDGVINKDNHDYTYRIEDFFILDGVFEALVEFLNRNFKLIIISNQAGIARNIYTHEDVAKVHTYLLNELKKYNIVIDEIYYCPHYDTTGKCICRKPDSLLLEKAISRFNIDPGKSYFIGDRDRDMAAAVKAGVKGIKVETDIDLRKILHLIQ